MPSGSGSSSGALVVAGLEVTALVGLTGAAAPGGAATGLNGLRGRAGRSVSAPGGAAGMPGGPALGETLVLAVLLAGNTVALAGPPASANGSACGCASLALPVADARLLSGAGLLPEPMTAR